MLDFLIRNGVIADGIQGSAVGIKDGLIDFIGGDTDLPAANTVIDAGGGLISPPFVDPHFHFENAFMMGSRTNLSGTLNEAIEIFNEDKIKITVPEIMARAEKTIDMALANGIGWNRPHPVPVQAWSPMFPEHKSDTPGDGFQISVQQRSGWADS